MNLDIGTAFRTSTGTVSPGNHTSEALAPVASWPSMQKAEHFVQFYESDDFIARSVADYMVRGLEADDVCITVATPDHREAIVTAIEENGLNVAEIRKEGRYIELDARETLDKFMQDGLPDRKAYDKHVLSIIKKAQKKGPVRIYGEMVGLLMADRMIEACSQLEQIWEDVCHKHPITLFCGYPLGEFAHGTGAESMVLMCGHHSRVIPSESYTSLESPDERMRAIAVLQQRGKQLEAELAELRQSIAAKA